MEEPGALSWARQPLGMDVEVLNIRLTRKWLGGGDSRSRGPQEVMAWLLALATISSTSLPPPDVGPREHLAQIYRDEDRALALARARRKPLLAANAQWTDSNVADDDSRVLDLSRMHYSVRAPTVLPSKSWRLRTCAALLGAATAMQGMSMGFHVHAMFGGDEPPPQAFESLVAACVMLVTLLGALASMVSQLLLWAEPASEVQHSA